jgi:hypothetical protein
LKGEADHREPGDRREGGGLLRYGGLWHPRRRSRPSPGRYRSGRVALASQGILISRRAATQHATVTEAVIQASVLSPERTASSQKKALARAQEIAPTNQKEALTSLVPVELAGDLVQPDAEADGAAVRAGGREAAREPVLY